MRRRHTQSPSSTTTQQQRLLSNEASSNNDNNDASNRNTTASSLQQNLPTFNRGIYFGGWEEPVYEKTTPLNIQSNTNNNHWFSSSSSSSNNYAWVQVHAVGVNPVDSKHVIGDKLKHDWITIRKLAHNRLVQNTRVGFDFAGVVVVAPNNNNKNNNSHYPIGTKVFGTMPPLQGSCAEYIRVPLHQMAIAPTTLTMTEAAALPLVGLTAWQALSPYMKLPIRNDNDASNHPSVLIIGGSGGTGHVALQVAKALGARDLVTICSARNVDFVKACGATRVIDYSKFGSNQTNNNNNSNGDEQQQQQQQQEEMMQEIFRHGPFDLILDCVTSADPQDSCYQYPARIRKYQEEQQQQQHDTTTTTKTTHGYQYLYQRLGGEWSDWIRAGLARVVPKYIHKWLWKDPRERLFWIRFPHSSQELYELAQLANDGKLKPKIQKIYHEMTAATVQQAMDDIIGRRVQGKVVVQIVDPNETETTD